MSTARIMAGIPATNMALYHAVRFKVGDPAAVVDFERPGAAPHRVFIVRDIEMDRARRHARADAVACPRDFEPHGGLSGDRETATAQAVAECVRIQGVRRVVADRTLPLVFAEHLRAAGVHVELDPHLGVATRRSKDEQEVAWLRDAQAATERAMRMACETIARAAPNRNGVLTHEGQPLTSEHMRFLIDVQLLREGFHNPPSIVACGPQGADCHDHGTGELRTGQPIIVDIFPRDQRTLYNGDCTRTVVHGQAHPDVVKMHRTVVEAKRAAIAATRAGVTGEDVHRATLGVIHAAGYTNGLPPGDAPDTWCGMTHGTGHGIGLDVHEPPLLDFKGPQLVRGDALTIEPGLYCKAHGGIRVEDMVIVTDTAPLNLNTLFEGLDWR
ncbi:MAG: M24 family metallopeptidase [Phycisphaerales bacterium]